MELPWSAVAPPAAIVLTIAATESARFLTGKIRSRDYRLFEDRNARAVADRFPLPDAARSDAEQRRKSLSPLFGEVHKAANEAQTEYYKTVVRSAACLVLAFLCLAAGAFLGRGEWSGAPALELVLSWIEIIAIAAVLALYWHGRRVSRPWIAARTLAELLRQYQFLSVVIPSGFSIHPGEDLGGRFLEENAQIAKRVLNGPYSRISARIENFWAARKACVANATLTEADLTADAVLLYLEKRARRQLVWFVDSAQRLQHVAERRGGILLALYCCAAGLAVTKHGFILCQGNSPPYIAMLLLIVTGLSAAMTAYYVNQNSRSLVHRYITQQRFIESWLKEFDSRTPFAAIAAATMNPGTKNEIRNDILRFEELLIGELADWISITTHDSIELAP
jgi:hypothetical protein